MFIQYRFQLAAIGLNHRFLQLFCVYDKVANRTGFAGAVTFRNQLGASSRVPNSHEIVTGFSESAQYTRFLSSFYTKLV